MCFSPEVARGGRTVSDSHMISTSRVVFPPENVNLCGGNRLQIRINFHLGSIWGVLFAACLDVPEGMFLLAARYAAGPRSSLAFSAGVGVVSYAWVSS